jgi:hypothetical protein
MKFGRIVMGVALAAGLMLGAGATVAPAAAQAQVACPPGYFFLPGTGCQLLSASNLNNLNYSELNYSFGSPQPYAYAPDDNSYYYYAPFAVIGGIGIRGFHGKHHGRFHKHR